MAVLIAGCASQASAVRALPPLEKEGEVYAYLEPLPHESGRLSFSIESMGVVGSDGVIVPLQVALPAISAREVNSQALLAWGRVPPGTYTAFVVKVRKATMSTEEGTADLLVPTEPTRIAASFRLDRQRATVWSLSFRYPESIQKSFGFQPVFSAVMPPRTAAPSVGYCSNAGMDNLTVLDKRLKRVTGVMTTGRGPGSVLIDPSGNRAYVALSGSDEVQIIDVAAGAEVSRVHLNRGDRPRQLALASGGRILVSVNTGSNTASFIDTVAGLELTRVQTGDEPSAILADRAGRRAYVFNRRSSSITVLDLPNRSVASTIPTDPEPIYAQLNGSGTRLYVIAAGSAYMTVYALPGQNVVGRTFVGLGMSAIKVDRRTELIYLAKEGEGRIFVHDPLSFQPIDDFDVPESPSWMAIDDLENMLWALMPARRSIAVIDLTSRKVVSTVDVGLEPSYVSLVGERF